MSMKKVLSVLMSVGLTLSLAACGSGNAAPAASQGGESTAAETSEETSEEASSGGSAVEQAVAENWEIAVVPKDSTNPWFVRMDTGVKEYADETGVNCYQIDTGVIDRLP